MFASLASLASSFFSLHNTCKTNEFSNKYKIVSEDRNLPLSRVFAEETAAKASTRMVIFNMLNPMGKKWTGECQKLFYRRKRGEQKKMTKNKAHFFLAFLFHSRHQRTFVTTVFLTFLFSTSVVMKVTFKKRLCLFILGWHEGTHGNLWHQSFAEQSLKKAKNWEESFHWKMISLILHEIATTLTWYDASFPSKKNWPSRKLQEARPAAFSTYKEGVLLQKLGIICARCLFSQWLHIIHAKNKILENLFDWKWLKQSLPMKK
mgnify:CR=1 FL=1